MATRSNITLADPLFVGADQQIVIDSVKDDAGLPLDCSGFTLHFVMAHHPEDVTPLIDVSGAAIVASDGEGTGDKITITLSDTQTDVLKRRRYRYSLSRVDAGNEYPISFGTVDVEQVVVP